MEKENPLRKSHSTWNVLSALLIVIAIVLFGHPISLSGQDLSKKSNGGGAKFLTKEEYDKLPKANRDTIKKKLSLVSSFLVQTATVKMLNNPPVGDQGTQQSCVGWSTSTALGILAHPKYQCWQIADRSPSYIYNQIRIGGCNGGAYLSTGVDFIINNGSCSKLLMPYDPANCNIIPGSPQNYDATYNTALSKLILTRTDYQSMKAAIDQGHPIVIGFYWSDSFEDMWYDDGIWDIYYGPQTWGHATCIVGYDDNLQMFKVQNSMGTADGDNGFFWMTYNLVRDGCLTEAYVVSGMNNSNPLSITGPSPALVCSSGSQFILNHNPGGTVIWSSSSNLNKSSGSGNTAVYTAIAGASGSGYVMASLQNCSSSIQYDVWAGVPQITYPRVDGIAYGFPPARQICPGNHWLNVTPYGAGAGRATWTVPSGIPYIAGDNTLDFTVPYYWSNITISARSANSCGNSANFNFYLAKKTFGCPSSFAMTLSPNPASDHVTIKVQNDESNALSDSCGIKIFEHDKIESEYTVNIYNNQSMLILKTSGYGQEFDIQLPWLRDGLYIIELSDGSNVSRQQLIIKHR